MASIYPFLGSRFERYLVSRAAQIRWSDDRQELIGNESQECKQGIPSIYDVSIDYSIGLYAIYPHHSYAIGDQEKNQHNQTKKNKQVSGTHSRRDSFCVSVQCSGICRSRKNSREMEICVGESCSRLSSVVCMSDGSCALHLVRVPSLLALLTRSRFVGVV